MDEGHDDVFELSPGQDPMDRFGFGIVSYFLLLRNFLFYFLVIGVLSLPGIFEFNREGGVQSSIHRSFFESYQVANYGEAYRKCERFSYNSHEILFGCKQGILAEFTSVGIVNMNSPAYA